MTNNKQLTINNIWTYRGCYPQQIRSIALIWFSWQVWMMIEIKSSKKCCKCFLEENALLHLIWILLCSIEPSPFPLWRGVCRDGGAAEHVVWLVTDCRTAAAPAPANGETAGGVGVLQQGSLQHYYDTTTTPPSCRSLPCSRGGSRVSRVI